MSRRELPTGTVTFLFTDIERSTRLLHTLGADEYASALETHRRLLRDAFAVTGGVEVDTQGDAFLVAFGSCTGAAHAAAAAHAVLEAGPIRVRIGLHTGEPRSTGEGYVGEDVHRGARIAALAHGGQTLVSAATAGLLGDADLRDVGLHRLKDFSGAERIYQLGAGEFPPLRTPGSVELPTPATPFLGREREILDALAIVLDRDPRVLTVLGPGGTGKTRFAIEVASLLADEAAGGTVFVPLAPLRDAELVVPLVAERLGAPRAETAAIAARIGGRRTHVVLDNVEHLLPGVAAPVAELAAAAPMLRFLVTSREPLRVQGEHELDLPPLAEADAVNLFRTRAAAVGRALDETNAVHTLCTRLDRLPLAIELAAARAKLMPPEALLERLSSAFDLPSGTRDADPRHSTLRATIAWSYDLLDEADRTVFAKLAVFRGSWTLESAERVCETDAGTIASLLDKSLIRRRDDERFFMLETIREFAREKLAEEPGAIEVERRLARWMLDVATSARMSVETGVGLAPQRHDIVLADLDNIRAAIDWAAEHDVALAYDLVSSLESFWTAEPFEARRQVEELLERGHDVAPLARARLLRVHAGTAQASGAKPSVVRASYEASLAEYERLGDDSGIATILLRLGFQASFAGDTERARELARRGADLGRRAGVPLVELLATGLEMDIRVAEGDNEGAYEWALRSAEVAASIGFVWFRSIALIQATDRGLALGLPWREVEPLCREAARLAREMGHRAQACWALTGLARIELRRGDMAAAGRIWGGASGEIEANPAIRADFSYEPFADELFRTTDPLFLEAMEDGRVLGLDAVLEQEAR